MLCLIQQDFQALVAGPNDIGNTVSTSEKIMPGAVVASPRVVSSDQLFSAVQILLATFW